MSDYDTAQAAIAVAAEVADLNPRIVAGESTARRATDARAMAMWLLRQRGWTLARVGAVLGRVHTTVSRGARRFDDQMEASWFAARADAALETFNKRLEGNDNEPTESM